MSRTRPWKCECVKGKGRYLKLVYETRINMRTDFGRFHDNNGSFGKGTIDT